MFYSIPLKVSATEGRLPQFSNSLMLPLVFSVITSVLLIAQLIACGDSDNQAAAPPPPPPAPAAPAPKPEPAEKAETADAKTDATDAKAEGATTENADGAAAEGAAVVLGERVAYSQRCCSWRGEDARGAVPKAKKLSWLCRTCLQDAFSDPRARRFFRLLSQVLPPPEPAFSSCSIKQVGKAGLGKVLCNC